MSRKRDGNEAPRKLPQYLRRAPPCLRSGLFAVGLSLVGCSREDPPPTPQHTTTPDRLAEDEVLPDRETAFGIELPRALKVTARYEDVVQMEGRTDVTHLVQHFKDHVLVAAIEMSPTQAVFPRAYIKGDKSKRLYRIVITKHGKYAKVRMTDVTGAPAVKGLDETERWERAGLNRDGSQKDRLNVY